MFELIKKWLLALDMNDNHTWRFRSERLVPVKVENGDNQTWRFRR